MSAALSYGELPEEHPDLPDHLDEIWLATAGVPAKVRRWNREGWQALEDYDRGIGYVGLILRRLREAQIPLLFVAGGSERYKTYAVHGRGWGSVRAGLAELAMPSSQQQAAMELVSEIAALNGAVDFVWYMSPGTAEVKCYWDWAPTNLLWITTVGVLVKRGGPVTPLARPCTYDKAEGDYLGWLLPGAEPGTGGGAKDGAVATVLCPVTYLRQPAGQTCPDCEVVHA